MLGTIMSERDVPVANWNDSHYADLALIDLGIWAYFTE